MQFDILISGAGPAGLCLARALSESGLNIGLINFFLVKPYGNID